MSVSERVQVPPDLGKADSFEAMRLNVEQLRGLDTPQALPKLGELDAHTPGRLSLLFRFAFWTAIAGALVGVLILLLAGGSALTMLAGIQLLPQSDIEIGAWFVIWLGWGVLILAAGERARDKLKIKLLEPAARLPGLFSVGLWPVRIAALSLALAFLVLGITAMLLVVLHGCELAWSMAVPRLLEFEIPLWGIYAIALSIIAIITFVLARKHIWFPVLLLWGLGVWGLLDDGASSYPIQVIGVSTPIPSAFVAIAMSLVYPLRISHLFATINLRLFRGWQSEVVRLFQGWQLRNSLSRAFAYHRRRNQMQVAGEGKHAVCKRDLEYFVPQQAGPVKFWWCPVCQDDDQVYTRVRSIQGVLDTAMSVPHEQQGHVLRINLLDWRRNGFTPPPLSMQEVLIGKLDNPHEVEWFITQYQTVQHQQRNWLPLHRIRPVITPQANIDEHTRRQIQDNMMSA